MQHHEAWMKKTEGTNKQFKIFWKKLSKEKQVHPSKTSLGPNSSFSSAPRQKLMQSYVVLI